MSHGSGLIRTTCSSGGAPGPSQPSEGLLDRVYPRTQGALLKVAQMVTLLIAFICVRSSSPWIDYGAYSFFEVVTICDLIMILVFYLVHLFRFYRVLTCISWPLSELLHYVIGTLLLLIASIVAASKSYNQSGLVAGAVRCFLQPVQTSAPFLPIVAREGADLGAFLLQIHTYLNPASYPLQRAWHLGSFQRVWEVG
ncbi:CKLF-like MARVEL transmembrane domain-containing protein 7 [Alexandromys fortis]|uniref:CKLF-like MARVEL transmembrane domain-containing protein 7 n=1 Tax=Alexandromys fortis TaxID=100897 RepID=UPI002152C7D3|nr:CKLF-like MARVEL transmembrane domain-containing protein 7 [Microtus fortis]